jgi:hypothetical protein
VAPQDAACVPMRAGAPQDRARTSVCKHGGGDEALPRHRSADATEPAHGSQRPAESAVHCRRVAGSWGCGASRKQCIGRDRNILSARKAGSCASTPTAPASRRCSTTVLVSSERALRLRDCQRVRQGLRFMKLGRRKALTGGWPFPLHCGCRRRPPDGQVPTPQPWPIISSPHELHGSDDVCTVTARHCRRHEDDPDEHGQAARRPTRHRTHRFTPIRCQFQALDPYCALSDWTVKVVSPMQGELYARFSEVSEVRQWNLVAVDAAAALNGAH